MNATDDEITALLRRGQLSNSGIARTLRVDKHRVGRIRRELGLPNVQPQPLTLEQKWRSKTRPVEGGHLAWTGEHGSTSRTPVLRYKDQCHTAAAIAFRLRTGRAPEGYAYSECGYFHCVSPDHVDDEPGRQLTREQLRYLVEADRSARPNASTATTRPNTASTSRTAGPTAASARRNSAPPTSLSSWRPPVPELTEARLAEIRALLPTADPRTSWTALQDLLLEREDLVQAHTATTEELASWTGSLAP